MNMTTQPRAVPPIPEGYHTVTPWIIPSETAKLLDFVKQAFGAEEMAKRARELQYREAMRSFQESLDREMKRRSEAAQRTDGSR
jgi:hypothetical protein